ncbi:transposon Tf2-6 polyprotein [Trichonephila inaurata madagascariensis]|uniref:Transposon Tf2-6 polyprotein n=1 Tax=Trichonephila inaurata madagascariensis TaxID=2747483 RepID=A0A8X6WRR3_9ARAC|nr:transposon Tf2-6 polyprotein [Trichonephila inaurata madagascariensis]
MELGDRHPSDLLRQMKSLAGSSISDELIKSLWLQRLPQQTQAILSISKDSLNNIAEMADKIIAVYSSSEHGVWKPLSFFSRKLTDAQKRYSTYDRELLAAYSSVKYLKKFLEGRNFTIITDHKPIIYAFRQKLDKATPRQQRHLEYIAQFTVDVQHVPGKDITTIDYEGIAKAQEMDEGLKKILSYHNSSLKLEKVPIFGSNFDIFCDCSAKEKRPYIPEAFWRIVFNNIHNLAHILE